MVIPLEKVPRTFQISDKHLDEFIALYKSKFGKDIDRKEALDSALKLVYLTDICLQGMFGGDYQLTGHQFKINGMDYIQAKIPKEQYVKSITEKIKKVYDWNETQCSYFMDDLIKMDGCLTCYSSPKTNLYDFINQKTLEVQAKKAKRLKEKVRRNEKRC